MTSEWENAGYNTIYYNKKPYHDLVSDILFPQEIPWEIQKSI